jgi:hypothetical protein
LPAPGLRFALPLFAATLFASALLLFAVQPMFTKMVLPMLGGAPAVWSVAMVFFQASLAARLRLCALLARTLPVAHAALVHLGVLGVAALTLPIGIAHFGDPPSSGIGLWLVGLFTASIGLPFAALSASAPLLQSWFAASGQARNPYVLYAASNLGSFAALLAYPLVLESLLPLRLQAFAWSVAFAGLAVLIAVAGVIAARGAGATVQAHSAAAAPPTLRDRLAWTALAAIPAGLVIAVTGLYLDRCGRGTAALGAAARALSADLRGGVPRQAVVPARPRHQGRAVPGGAPGDLAARRGSGLLGCHHRAQSAGAVRAGARMPRRGLCAPPRRRRG